MVCGWPDIHDLTSPGKLSWSDHCIYHLITKLDPMACQLLEVDNLSPFHRARGCKEITPGKSSRHYSPDRCNNNGRFRDGGSSQDMVGCQCCQCQQTITASRFPPSCILIKEWVRLWKYRRGASGSHKTSPSARVKAWSARSVSNTRG